MRFLRRTVMVASLLAAAGVLTVVMLLASLHTDVGRTIARDRLAAVLADASGGRVVFGVFETTPRLDTFVLRDVVISLHGQSVLRMRRVEIALGLPTPAPRTLPIRRLVIDGLTAHLVRRDGTFGATPPAREGSALTIRVGELAVRDARVGVVLADATKPQRFAFGAVSAEGALASGPGGQWLELATLRATPRGLPLEALTASMTLQAAHGGRLDVPSFQLVSGATRVDGRGSVDTDGSLTLRLRAASLAPELLAAVAPGIEWPQATSLDLVLAGPRHALTATGTLDLASAGTVTARGRVDASTVPPAYRVVLEGHDVVPGTLRPGWPSERVQATVRARGRGPRHTAHGRVVAESVRAGWRGQVVTGRAPTAQASASGEMRDLARLTGGPAGRFPFRLDARTTGALAYPERGRLTVELGHGTIGSTPIRQATAIAHLERGRIRIERVRVDGNDVVLRGDATFDPERVALEADLEVAFAGRADAATSLALARRERRWLGTIRTLRITPAGMTEWSSESPATLAIGDGVRVGDLRLRSGTQRAVLSGQLGPRGTLTGALALTDVQLTPLCAVAGKTCAGIVAGRLDVAGTVSAPRLTLAATARDVSAGPLDRTTVETDLRHERGRATGTVTIASLGGTVVVSGAAPAALPGTASSPDGLDLTITARKLALDRLPVWAPSIVRTVTGRVRADLHLGGTWASPRPEGTLTLRAPVLELVASGARWEDVHAVLRADGGSTLTIERLTAAGGKGTLTGSGALDFRAGIVPTADVRLEFDRFLAVDRPVLEAACTGTLRVRDSLTAPTVRGKLYVPEGTVRPAFLPAANARTQPDPTIEVIGLPDDAPVPPPASLGQLTLGLTLTLGDGMHIRRRDADIQLGGTLHIERTPPEALRVRGTVKVEQGWYTFSGRRFTLRPGAVRFDGGPVGDAELDIEATRRTGEYDVTVAVQGTVAKPELLLSSDPPLDETDVLAVLLVGRPSGELNDSERLNVQAEAASLAVGYVVPGLSGVLEEALPLEQVQVSPEALRVGHRVGNDVFISLSQQFVGWAGQTMAVEYAITPRLSVELSTSSRGSGAIDFFWRRRY